MSQVTSAVQGKLASGCSTNPAELDPDHLHAGSRFYCIETSSLPGSIKASPKPNSLTLDRGAPNPQSLGVTQGVYSGAGLFSHSLLKRYLLYTPCFVTVPELEYLVTDILA
ncbi:hypothetical protein RSAG8_07615, partial [Rhizoctonia solani AG-8 WAC10335]